MFAGATACYVAVDAATAEVAGYDTRAAQPVRRILFRLPRPAMIDHRTAEMPVIATDC